MADPAPAAPAGTFAHDRRTVPARTLTGIDAAGPNGQRRRPSRRIFHYQLPAANPKLGRIRFTDQPCSTCRARR